MDIKALKKEFLAIYGEEENDLRVFFAPGRVNLIGEHTDYNGGYVLPASLNFGTYMVLRETTEKAITFHSLNMEFSGKVALDGLKEKHDGEWIDYPLGVIDQLVKRGLSPQGAQTLFYGNIPNGAGLSSSASIEVLTSVALTEVWGKKIELKEIALLSQAAENEFVGVNCGIMDQFAVAMGQDNSALFLNCDTLDYKTVNLELGDYRLVIANTNKKRKLSDSKYNERRAECEQAVSEISKVKEIKNLSALNVQTFEELKENISSETVVKRAEHVIKENQRVLDAVAAMENSKLETLGRLMNESHDSLRDLYEVTGIELDTLVDEARKVEGVLGARMTGAGFGGCTVSLVREDKIEDFKQEVEKNYKEKTGLTPDFYVPQLGAQPGEL